MPIDYKQYHPKWSLIRRLVLKRAEHKCKKCGILNGTDLPIISSDIIVIGLFGYAVQLWPRPSIKEVAVLTVAHLDHDRNNNRFWNLAALCRRCHLQHDVGQRIFSRKYGKETQYVNGKLFQ